MNPDETQSGPLARALDLKQQPLGRKMVRGVIFSVLRKIVGGPLFLLLIPFTLHKVGAAGYGAWAILMTVISISGFLDWGLGESVIKHVAEYNGRKDLEQIRQLLNTILALYFFIAALMVCLLALGSRLIVHELFRGASSQMANHVLSMWPLLLVIVAADILARPFTSTIYGLQRIDIANVILFTHSLVNAVLTVALLLAGMQLGGLLVATLLSSMFNLAACTLITRKLLPTVLANPLRSDLVTLRRICKFSLALFSGRMMVMIQAQVEKLYLARLVGVVQVGWYEVASEAASKVRRLPDQLLSPVMAAASELHATDDSPKMRELFFRTNKYFAVSAIPFVVFALFTAKVLLGFWLGPNLVQIAVPFAGLVIGNFFLQVGAPVSSVLTGKGILRPGVYAALVMCALNVVLSFLFIERWGFAGAMLGTVLSMMVGNLYFFITAAPHLDVPFHQTLVRAYSKPLACALAAALAMWPVRNLEIPGWQRLSLSAAAFGIVYLVGLILLRFFDSFDLTKAERYVPCFGLARRLLATPIASTAEEANL